MTTTSRGISLRSRAQRNSHTPGKEKGGLCKRTADAMLATRVNPYKGQGLKGQPKAMYNRFWDKMLPVNGIKPKSE